MAMLNNQMVDANSMQIRCASDQTHKLPRLGSDLHHPSSAGAPSHTSRRQQIHGIGTCFQIEIHKVQIVINWHKLS